MFKVGDKVKMSKGLRPGVVNQFEGRVGTVEKIYREWIRDYMPEFPQSMMYFDYVDVRFPDWKGSVLVKIDIHQVHKLEGSTHWSIVG